MPTPSRLLRALASACVVQASAGRQGVGKTELALPGRCWRASTSQARGGRGTSTKPIGMSTDRMESPSQASARVFTTRISRAPSVPRRQTTQPVRQPSAPPITSVVRRLISLILLLIILLSPARGRGGERGLRTSLPPLLASPPNGGEEHEGRGWPGPVGQLPRGHLGLEVGVEARQEILGVLEGLLGPDKDRG